MRVLDTNYQRVVTFLPSFVDWSLVTSRTPLERRWPHVELTTILVILAIICCVVWLVRAIR